MKKLNNFQWEVQDADVQRITPVVTPDSIAFIPEGACGPIKFTVRPGARCGTVQGGGLSVDDRMGGRWQGGSLMTPAQALAMLAFLKEHESRLVEMNTPIASGDVHESGWPVAPHDDKSDHVL